MPTRPINETSTASSAEMIRVLRWASGEIKPVSFNQGSQSGLPVGEEPADGSRSEAELGPVSSGQGSRSGLPVGEEPADGSRSEAELGPVSFNWGLRERSVWVGELLEGCADLADV
jgi:hypothetical protein